MANPILRLLGSSQPVVPGASALWNQSGRNIQSGFNAFQKVADHLDEVKRNTAIKQLLTAIPQTDDPYALQQRLGSDLMNVKGLDPLAALGLAQKAVEPQTKRYEQQVEAQNQSYDRLKDERKYQLEKQKAERPDYASASDDYGNIWLYDKHTGEKKLMQRSPYMGTPSGSMTGPAGSGMQSGTVLPPKFVDTRTVTEETPYGGKTIYSVRTDKRTGDVVSKTPIGKSAKPISQQDKDAISATKKSLDLIDDIEKAYSEDIVGPVDNALSWGANLLGINTDQSVRNRQLNATLQNLKANLTAALIKGVPSDKDMAVIEGMLPSTTDSEEVFMAKLKNIKRILAQQGAAFTKDYLEPSSFLRPWAFLSVVLAFGSDLSPVGVWVRKSMKSPAVRIELEGTGLGT